MRVERRRDEVGEESGDSDGAVFVLFGEVSKAVTVADVVAFTTFSEQRRYQVHENWSF
jgi:hypothetical protein